MQYKSKIITLRQKGQCPYYNGGTQSNEGENVGGKKERKNNNQNARVIIEI